MQTIPTYEGNIDDNQVFDAFNLDLPKLAHVKSALQAHEYETAKKALVDYFHQRSNVKFLFDYRGIPLSRIEPDDSPYAYQSSLGLNGNLKEFCLYVGEQMMHNIFVMPGKGRGEIDLGAEFENMIHFDFIKDQGKRHRTQLDMFVRGQFFESMAVLYHENGDKRVAEHFAEVLRKFFDTYPLKIANTAPDAERFQLDEDRDIMSVGWLALTYLTLLYTELAYAVDYTFTFEIIKHLWFLGIQFRRFDTDTYRPFNHHMWERGMMPFILGTLLPEVPDFVVMRDKGATIVSRHVMEDFNEYGGYNEHSIAYWSGAAMGGMLFRVVYLAKENHLPLLDDQALARVSQSFDILAMITPPQERFPSMGDNRGPLVEPILSLGVQMTDNHLCKEVLQIRKAHARKVIPLDYCNDKTGFACCHNGYDINEDYLLMSVKTNCGYSGHNHMDMLSMFISIRGESIIAEPYAGTLYHKIRMASSQRGYMYNMGAHNTVLVYGQPIVPDSMYANKWGVFRPDSPVTAFRSDCNGCYIEAFHDGYTFSRHTRKVLFARNGAILIRDEIMRGNRIDSPHIQRWHLEQGCTCRSVGVHALIIEQNKVRVLCVWAGSFYITISSLKGMLFPEIYQDESQLAPLIDISFSDKDTKEENPTVSLNLLMLDITKRKEQDLEQLCTIAAEIGDDMTNEDALSKLAAL